MNRIALAAIAAAVFLPLSQSALADAVTIDEIVVTSSRRATPRQSHPGNIAVLDEALIESIRHQHVHELLTRVAGVWLSRGSGQEHLTAIRSPVLAGAGSCGAYLVLEDGIPTRPSGFCNVNQMFEVVSEHAARVEVIRGPANALYGSNALHGVVNVVMPVPGENASPTLGVEGGQNDFFRVFGRVPFSATSRQLLAFSYARDGGFRDDSGYRQAKLHAKHATLLAGGELLIGFSATDLDQETAGFILGQDAYRDPAVNRSNANPEAFRDANSQRLYGLWSGNYGDAAVDVRPYIRRSDMSFLQHFLPGQPLEENSHHSAGVLTSVGLVRGPWDVTLGLDVEWSRAELVETQDGATVGSAFLVETRPEGKHYDYETRTWSVSPYLQSTLQMSDRLQLHAGVRFERLQHDYSNRMLTGNTRDDGSVCGFGGCLYSRPASRDDAYTNTAPKLSLTFATTPQSTLYANVARGFRAPQATELYRLQSGQQVADLNSETIDSLELGWRRANDGWSMEIVAYWMKKKDSVLRDADGFNISNGRSQHRGIEFESEWQLHRDWRTLLNIGYGRHTYDFDFVAARGETFVTGADVDTAPKWLGSADLLYTPPGRYSAALQWTMIGDYYLDAENQVSYPGHDLFNLRLTALLNEVVDMTVRVNNVTDTDYADRADFAFGNYRYFPGRGREVFLELRYTPQ